MGPLEGLRVVELGAIGAAPFGCMILADLGADVIRLDHPALVHGPSGGRYEALANTNSATDVLNRGRRFVSIDLKKPEGRSLFFQLVSSSDVLVEGFRPGVVERLGVGPEQCFVHNRRLVFARATGWGQEGPLAHTAGHDIDYIAVAGALGLVGREEGAPVPPASFLGDFAGGGMLLVIGILSALFEAESSQMGQVVDAAMVDGAALLTAAIHGMRAGGYWGDRRGTNLLDTGAPFYDVYETADGQHVAVGACEPEFYAELIKVLELDSASLPPQLDRAGWPELRRQFADAFAMRTRDEWAELFEGTDACVAPVLGLGEVPTHAHNQARHTFVEVDGVVQPAPAPRFSRTPGAISRGPRSPGSDTDRVLTDLGISEDRIAVLRGLGAIA